ncbi:YrhB domain-containing protein [Amycolatopsis anabasis]|uniref:YrhB domain-containing protein n=1 Tax=Amycolatopsis anabasis TaxID=1840409 RepID=UPI00131B09A6|nr:YrhB domain-containing protein [Amycolatopsis anabasis]
MDAEEAIARVEAWLRDSPEGDLTVGDSALRVQRDLVARGADGWTVPFNAAAFLDGEDIGKGIFPTPVVLVPDDGGEIRYATELMADGGGPVDEDEPADFDEIPEPVWRGWPVPRTPAESLANYYRSDLIDRATFVRRLLDTEVLAPLDERGDPVTRPRYGDAVDHPVFSSSVRVTAGYTRWRRLKAGDLLAPGAGLLLDPGRPLAEEFHHDELAAAATGRKPGGRYVDEVSAEIDPRVTAATEQLTGEFGLGSPQLLDRNLATVAAQARNRGYELTVDECLAYARGFAWNFRNLRGLREGREPAWPEDLAANGLITHYDDAGAPRPVPWTFGKFSARAAQDGNFAWHRIVGAFVGFAAGEARALSSEVRLGPLTRQLLTVTDMVLRGLPQINEDGTIPPGFPPPVRTDGWLATALAEDGGPATGSPLVTALAATLAGGTPLAEAGEEYPRAVARDLLGVTDQDTATAVDTVVWLFWRLLDTDAFALPVHIRLQELTRAEGPATGLARTVLALREQRDADDLAQAATLGDGREPLSVLGRALFAAAKRHYDPELALRAAGGDPLVAALAGAMAGARGGVPGLPESWLAGLPRLGLVENVAADAHWHFNRFGVVREPGELADWEQRRYPRT